MASPSSYHAGTVQSRAMRRHRSRNIVNAASDSEVGTVGVAAIGLGALANPIVLASDWTLITTGKGFPEGPYGTPLLSKSSPYTRNVAEQRYAVYSPVMHDIDVLELMVLLCFCTRIVRRG